MIYQDKNKETHVDSQEIAAWPGKTDFIFPYVLKDFPGFFYIFPDLFFNGQKGILGGNN